MKRLVVTLIWISSLVLLGSRAWAWQANVSGSANGQDEARAVVVDTAGHAVVAGLIENTGTARDFTVVKFDGATGAELWRRVINGSRNDHDQARAVAVDAAGHVVAAGVLANATEDFTVVKFDGATGTELWRRVINGTRTLFGQPAAFDEAVAVTVDGDGNVVAAGRTENAGTFSDFTVIKFDAAGTELWRQVINGPVNRTDRARAVAVDVTGNVVAVGRFQTTSDGFGAATVIKLDGATGMELWRQVVGGGPDSEASAVTVDPAGDVVAAGCIFQSVLFPVGIHCDFTVIKFDGMTGAEAWRQVINGTATFSVDQARAVAVDADGNVVAAGSLGNADTAEDFTIIKFDGATGTELWRQEIDGPSVPGNLSADEARAVTVDADGNVVGAGVIGKDFTVIKFDRATGAEFWRRVIDGTNSTSDAAMAVGVDAAGNAAAAGFTENTVTGQDFTVVKVAGTDGSDTLTPPAIATQVFLHGSGGIANPPTLVLDGIAPTGQTAKFRDSSAVSFSGGNPWKEIGTWSAAPDLTDGALSGLAPLHVWLGLKNSDDQGTQFDLRADVEKNGATTVGGCPDPC